MKITWKTGNDETAVIESTPMETERFNAICGIIKLAIVGYASVQVVSLIGTWGIFAIGAVALFWFFGELIKSAM